MKTKVSVILLLVIFKLNVSAQETIIHYLSGIDKDHTVDWDFYCTKGAGSGQWTKIPVPSNWEQHGFGAYNYGHDKKKADEQSLYKFRFRTIPAWKNKKIFIVFEGSMTDTEVKINGMITGESWQYPEFKGYHSEMYWVRIENKETPFTVYTNQQGLFLQMLKPAKPVGASNNNTSPAFPDGNIGFLNPISSIGTKFQEAKLMGSQSQKNVQLNYTPASGSLV